MKNVENVRRAYIILNKIHILKDSRLVNLAIKNYSNINDKSVKDGNELYLIKS